MWFEETLGQCSEDGAWVISLKIYLVTCAVAVLIYNDGRFGCLVNCLYMLTHEAVYGHFDKIK